MKTCRKVLDVLIGVVDNVLHHFVSYEKFKTFNWRFRSLGSSSRSFCIPQYVLVCSSATNSSFFLCMPLPGEFLVCIRIGVRFTFIVLNFQVLVVSFIATFIKSFEQLLSCSYSSSPSSPSNSLSNTAGISSSSSEASKETSLSNGVSSSSEMLSKKSCIACSCCCSDENYCFFFGDILSLFLTSFHFSY